MSVICPDCEVELEEGAEKCPGCGLGIFEIASRPRKRPKKKVKTITLYKMDKWWDTEKNLHYRVVSATYKDNPVNKILLEDTAGKFKWDKQVRYSYGSYGYSIRESEEECISSEGRKIWSELAAARTRLKLAEKSLKDFQASFPEWEPPDEEE